MGWSCRCPYTQAQHLDKMLAAAPCKANAEMRSEDLPSNGIGIWGCGLGWIQGKSSRSRWKEQVLIPILVVGVLVATVTSKGFF